MEPIKPEETAIVKTGNVVKVKAMRGHPLKWDDEAVGKEIEILRQYVEEESEQFPTLFKFASSRGYYHQIFSEWIESEHLSDTIKKKIKAVVQACKDKLSNAVVYGGLTNQLNPAMSIFVLKNVAGFKDNPQVVVAQQFNGGEVGNNQFRDKQELNDAIVRTVSEIQEIQKFEDSRIIEA